MARAPIAVPIPKRALERNAMPCINAGHAGCCPIEDTVGAQKPRPSVGITGQYSCSMPDNAQDVAGRDAGLARRETRRNKKKCQVKGTRIET